ncbi:PDR/VanB family oxidoreductase [Undibacterium arcticum]
MRAPDKSALPAFRAGAHLRFMLPVETGAVERCYSLINASEQKRDLSHRGTSCGTKQRRFVLHVRKRHGRHPPPSASAKNDFVLTSGGRHHVLLAGGIGITPIFSMAKALAAANQSFEIHYVARTPESMAYRDEIAAAFDDRVQVYFDHGDPSMGMPLQRILAGPENGTHVYVCGPQPMIDSVLANAQLQGWRGDSIHFELFAPPATDPSDSAIEVTLARSHQTVQVPAGKPILDALLEHGCDLLYDCRRGECGICAVPVLEGVPEHRDYALSESQKRDNSTMCICVSRAKKRNGSCWIFDH